MTIDANKGEKTKKIFDIAKPGKTVAEASGRPVIVGHKNMLKEDPMVIKRGILATDIMSHDSEDRPSGSPADAEAGVPIKPAKEPSLATIKIEPLSDPENLKPQPKTDHLPETEVKAQSETSNISESAGVKAVAEQTEQQKNHDKTAQESTAKQQTIEKLIAEKQYFVPISGKSGKKSLSILLVVIVLAVVIGILLFIMMS